MGRPEQAACVAQVRCTQRPPWQRPPACRCPATNASRASRLASSSSRIGNPPNQPGPRRLWPVASIDVCWNPNQLRWTAEAAGCCGPAGSRCRGACSMCLEAWPLGTPAGGTASEAGSLWGGWPGEPSASLHIAAPQLPIVQPGPPLPCHTAKPARPAAGRSGSLAQQAKHAPWPQRAAAHLKSMAMGSGAGQSAGCSVTMTAKGSFAPIASCKYKCAGGVGWGGGKWVEWHM